MGMGFAMANQMGKSMMPGGQTPPPVPGGPAFFLAINGAQQGPFDANGLQQQAQSGGLTGTTLVWREGMTDWQQAQTVAELQPYLKATPPPLPPTE